VTKTIANDLTPIDDLEDLPGEGQPEPTKQTEPQWNGRRTRIRLAHPILRGTVEKPEGRFLDGGSRCIDCGLEGHQFHVSASRAKDGSWHGPESDSIATLQRKGYLTNTKEARDRDDADRKRRDLIGPEATPVLTAVDLERMWRYEMRNGAVDPQIERQIKRDEMATVTSGLAAAIEPLVGAIRDKLVAAPEGK
jgi:hypothetical protein